MAAGQRIAGRLRRQARQRLLNEPFMLIMVSWSLWLYATLLYSGLFWLNGAESIEMLGRETLRDLIRRNAKQEARHIRDAILEDLDRFQEGTRPEDDITLIVVKREISSSLEDPRG